MNHRDIPAKTIALHGALWMFYVLLEYLANIFHIREGREMDFLFSTLLSLPVLMLPTYFIALYAVPGFLKKNKTLAFVISIVSVAIFVFFARRYWFELVNYIDQGKYFKMPMSKVFKNVIRDYSVIALAVCIYIIADWRKKQLHNEELIKLKAEAELKLLKGQLQPHFLFNTLNNIYSLALQKSDATADSILKLTELLDYLVYWANQDKVLLSKEVQLLQNYLDLESLRYGEKLKLTTHFNSQNDLQKVAPLTLLPFVENCFKHGRAGKNDIFWVNIELITDGDQLIFNIANSKKNTQQIKSQDGGIGLKNIQKRLQLIYPDRHQLNIEEMEDSFKVRLQIVFD